MSVMVCGRTMLFMALYPKNPLAAMPFTAYFVVVSPSVYSTVSGITTFSSVLVCAFTTTLSPPIIYVSPFSLNVCACAPTHIVANAVSAKTRAAKLYFNVML